MATEGPMHVLSVVAAQGPEGEGVAVVSIGDAGGAVEDTHDALLLPVAIRELALHQEADAPASQQLVPPQVSNDTP